MTAVGMTSLLKKDWRINRAALLGTILLLAVPHIIALLSIALSEHHTKLDDRRDMFLAAAGAGPWIVAAMAAVFGAIAFTVERTERSGEFLAMMPVSRGRIMLSKLAVALGCLVVLWLISGIVLGVFLPQARPMPADGSGRVPTVAQAIGASISVSLLSFGLAWALGMILSSSAFVFGIVTVVWVGGLILTGTWSKNSAIESSTIIIVTCVACVLTAGVCVVGGSIYYLRRVAP